MISFSDRTKLYVKIIASFVLLGFIAWSADWGQVGAGLRQADPLLLSVVFAIIVLCVVVSAYKWWLLLRLHKVPFAFSDLNRWYFIAMFFNNFLPTSIGGDGFRFYRTYKNQRYKSTAFVAILVERVSGILALLALGWIASIVSWLNDSSSLSWAFMMFGIVGLTVTALLLAILHVMKSRGLIASWNRLPRALQLLIEHLKDYQADLRGSFSIVLVSIVFHAISISWMFLLTLAIGADISLLELVVVSALVSVVTVIPLSINGIGLVDGAFIYLASQYGMSHADGLTFMILQRFLVLPVSVFGMFLYLVDRKRNGVPDLKAEKALIHP